MKRRTVALSRNFELLSRDLCAELRKNYGSRLISVVVFGSVGRGTPRTDSDLDVLIVAEKLPDGRLNRVEQFAAVNLALTSRLKSLEKAGIFTTLAPVIKTPAEVRQGSLLFLDMIDDGRVLFDRGDFWRSFMREFQKRLKRLGAKKIVVGDRWYWDLKPDYKPGDIFEI